MRIFPLIVDTPYHINGTLWKLILLFYRSQLLERSKVTTRALSFQRDQQARILEVWGALLFWK